MEILEKSQNIWFTKASASNDPYMARKIFDAGADGVRIAFSFGSQDLQLQLSDMFRKAGESVGKEVNVIADLQGEQVRIKDLGHHDKLRLPEGDQVTLTGPDSSFSETDFRIPVDSQKLIDAVEEGEKIYIGDGDVILVVEDSSGELRCRVESSGTINPRRGIQPQSESFEPSALTGTDRENLEFIAENSGKFDAVLLSFISNREDVEEARQIMRDAGEAIDVVSKIETGKGVENADEIAEASDAVMVARGDLALLEPWKELGENTEGIVEAAEEHDTPWVMATQLLEGLEHYSVPLRPEISDIQRWRDRGADGFMLCHETAFGEKPVEAVEKLDQLLR